MNEIVKRRSELLVENQKVMTKSFIFEHSITNAIVAAAFAEKDRNVDVDAIKDARNLLKKRKGVFSDFRAYNELIVSARMALSGNPEGYLDSLIDVYDKFKKGKLFGSSYKVLAAMSICDQGKYNDADRLVEKTNDLLKKMNKAHPMLTSDEDTCFAVLLAMTDKSVDDILTELEEAYGILKSDFAFHKDAVFSLAQVLTAYEGNAAEKSSKALDFFNAFKAAGAKYGKDYELASLGALIDIDADKDELVSDVIGVADHIKGKKGFGILDMGRETRLMFGTMLVTGAYLSADYNTGTSSLGRDIGRIVALQTAILITMMIVVATTAAASASH